MSDDLTLARIHDLVAEEDQLRDRAGDTGEGLSEQERGRIAEIEVALDQCWDLLRQRRARREFGEDPDAAHVRDPGTVEGYVQ